MGGSVNRFRGGSDRFDRFQPVPTGSVNGSVSCNLKIESGQGKKPLWNLRNRSEPPEIRFVHGLTDMADSAVNPRKARWDKVLRVHETANESTTGMAQTLLL